MPPDHVDLHRLVWSPDDIRDGKLLTSAFSKNDLKQQGLYVSVDRTDQLDEQTVQRIAEEQAARADGAGIIRETPHSAILGCGNVRNLFDTEQNRPFEVRPEELEDNTAHCGIHNVSGRRNKSYINQLRTLLVSVVHETLALSDYLAGR